MLMSKRLGNIALFLAWIAAFLWGMGSGISPIVSALAAYGVTTLAKEIFD